MIRDDKIKSYRNLSKYREGNFYGDLLHLPSGIKVAKKVHIH